MIDQKQYSIVHIKWTDSMQVFAWNPEDEVNLENLPVAQCESVGFLIEENDSAVLLALNINSEKNIGQIITIPKVNIVETIYYRRVRSNSD